MSSDEECGEDWVPYSQRPEWSDVTPLAQDDGDHPIVQIVYSDKFRDVYDYFRAIVAAREKSERALALTDDALKLNPANYTVWQYRRDVLAALGADLTKELVHSEDIILDNAKNYQVWHHRRCVVELLGDASRELWLTESVLKQDAKNYHAWQHRQWAMKTFNLFDDELVYADKLISQDVRNNSAWNQRFFVLKHTGLDAADVLEREIHYALNRIQLVKNNESSWSYLRGLLLEGGERTLNQSAEVVAFAERLYERDECRSPHLLAFLIDLYEERCVRGAGAAAAAATAGGDGVDGAVDAMDVKELDRLADRVGQLCAEMQHKYDVIREKYWEYVLFNFRSKWEQVRALAEAKAPKSADTAAPVPEVLSV